MSSNKKDLVLKTIFDKSEKDINTFVSTVDISQKTGINGEELNNILRELHNKRLIKGQVPLDDGPGAIRITYEGIEKAESLE